MIRRFFLALLGHNRDRWYQLLSERDRHLARLRRLFYD
jgi:hypothetical protein